MLGCEPDVRQLPALLQTVRLKGRCEMRTVAGREYLVDVAHNPSSVEKMIEYSDLTGCKGRIFAIFSAMADKDIPAMIAATGKHFDAWFVGDQPGNSRAATAADLATALYAAGHERVSVSKNLRQALARARSLMEEGDRLVVFGSFYTVAAVLPLLERENQASRGRR